MDIRSLFRKKKPDITALLQKKDTRGLIRALRFPDGAVRKEATAALCSIGPAAIDHLVRTLDAKDTMLKLCAIEALGKIRDGKAVSPLLARLHDESNEVRWETTIALGEIGDPSASAHLFHALTDPDKFVRYGAASALTRIGWKPESQEERALYFAALGEWKVLREIGDPALPALENALKDRDTGVRLQALETLGELQSSRSEPVVLSALSDPDSTVRWQAVLTSQKIGVPAAHLPRYLAIRPRNVKNPVIAGFLNFMLPGLGYGYLGKWWGVMIFQLDITATIWIFKFWGETNTYSVLFPVYVLLGVHAWYLAKKMPET